MQRLHGTQGLATATAGIRDKYFLSPRARKFWLKANDYMEYFMYIVLAFVGIGALLFVEKYQRSLDQKDLERARAERQ